MSAEVNALIMLAQLNETKGLYRRAREIWQNITTHLRADREQTLMAAEKINLCNIQLQVKLAAEVSPANSKKKDVENDKIKIQQLLLQGYSVKEIQFMTGRSSAFIYKYNPKGKAHY